MAILQLGMVYFSPLQSILQTTSLTVSELLISVLPATLLFLLVESEKHVTRVILKENVPAYSMDTKVEK